MKNLFSLYGFLEWDNTLFDGVVLPSGMDKEILINVILDFSGELKPYHQTPTRLKYSITNFFKRRYDSYSRMYTALTTQYSPLENYDRIENTSDTSSSKSESTSTSNSSSATSAFNSSYMEPTGSTSGSAGGNGSASGSATHYSRVHGNIGVTTNAQMLSGELEVRTYDLYKHIAMEFEKEILMQIY